MIKIYADGSSKVAKQTGGFGVVIVVKNELIYKYAEYCECTTNNREELKAIIHALQLAKNSYGEEVCAIYTDSMYCVNICNRWMWKWARNNWLNAKHQLVENYDLIKIIYKHLSSNFFNPQIIKCAGHSDIIGNELADALATGHTEKFNRILKENNIVDKTKNI